MVIGITRALNEADIIVPSIRRMLGQVDQIIVGNGPSVDGTREHLAALADSYPIMLLEDDKLNWQQNDVMSEYAQIARKIGAGWIVPFDIDEVWYAEDGTISDVLDDFPQSASFASAQLVTHCVTSDDDPDEPDPIVRMGWRNVDWLPLPKVACRTLPGLRIGHGNHSAAIPNVSSIVVGGVLRARHYPYRTPEQFITRVCGAWPMLRGSGLPESHGVHMWQYGRALDEGGPDALRSWFASGMFFEDPASNPALVHDPCPVMLPS